MTFDRFVDAVKSLGRYWLVRDEKAKSAAPKSL